MFAAGLEALATDASGLKYPICWCRAAPPGPVSSSCGRPRGLYTRKNDAAVDTSEGIQITFPKDAKPDGNKANFILFRTDDSNLDVKKEVTISQNYFIIPKKVITKGSYTLKLKWTENKIPYQIDYDILWK